MTLSVHSVTFDARDAYAIASWWAQALDAHLGDDDRPGDPECMVQLRTPGAAPLLFLAVPDLKRVKNRAHLDLQPEDPATRESEVDRLVGLGATVVDDLRNPDGTGWVVLADPEGNEFCVLRSAAQRAATSG